MSANGEEFKDASELKVWLEGKGVRERVASMTASTLFEQGFYKPLTLLGISSEQLERCGLSIPSANELSNALEKQVSLNLCVWFFVCCVRDLSVSPLFSLWVFPDPSQKMKRSGGAMVEHEPPLQRTVRDDIDEFFATFPKGQKVDADGVGTLLEFSKQIADTQKTLIVERECFQRLRQKVKQMFDGERQQSSIIVTGSSGIGKTFFGFFLAHQLINEGEIVALNYRNQKRVLFAPTVDELKKLGEDDERRFLLKLLQKHQEGKLAPLVLDDHGDQEGGIGYSSRFWGTVEKDNLFWNEILRHPRTWLVVDLRRDDKYEDGRQKCKIVVTSTLRAGDWPDLDDGGDLYSTKLFMNPLNLEEAKKILTAVEPSITEEEVERRYKLFGGSARALVNCRTTAQEKVDLVFQTGTSIGNLLDPNTDNPSRASMIVHIVANNEFQQVGRKFASQTIANRVVDSVICNKNLEMRVWMEATSGKATENIAGARGILAERLWHRAVKNEHQIWVKELTPVGKSNAAVELKQLTVTFGRTRRFTKSDLSDLLEMSVGDYCLPDNSQFPSVDSFAVLAENPWTSAEETSESENRKSTTCSGAAPSSETLGEVASAKSGPVGVMFQMAIGRKHSLAQQKTLRDIDQKMGDLVQDFTKGQSPLYLIYVTETADSFISNRLNYNKGEGKAYADAKNLPTDLARIKQFAMSFNKLTDG